MRRGRGSGGVRAGRGVCWPVGRVTGAQGWCGGAGLQVAVDQGDGGGAFADRGGDPFDRSLADVAGGEYAGQAGLQRQWRAAVGPAGVGAGGQVGAGGDEAPPVAGEGRAACQGHWSFTGETRPGARAWVILVWLQAGPMSCCAAGSHRHAVAGVMWLPPIQRSMPRSCTRSASCRSTRSPAGVSRSDMAA